MKKHVRVLTKENKKQIKSCRNLLSENGIDIKNVEFVFTNPFYYDEDNQIVEPHFIEHIPVNKNTNRVDIKLPKIIDYDGRISQYRATEFNFDFDYGLLKYHINLFFNNKLVIFLDGDDAVEKVDNTGIINLCFL